MKRAAEQVLLSPWFIFKDSATMPADIEEGMKLAVFVTRAEDRFFQIIVGEEATRFGKVRTHTEYVGVVLEKVFPFFQGHVRAKVTADRVAYLATCIDVGIGVQVMHEAFDDTNVFLLLYDALLLHILA
jgi:hypothetical protein